jgi:poly(hydroxyalkanoate) depolymerase family esterase
MFHLINLRVNFFTFEEMLKLFVCFFSTLFFSVNSLAFDITEIENFGSNPGNLKMYYYKPKNLVDSLKAPVVFVLHGCLQNAESVSELAGWNKLADINGFIVVYPQQKYANNSSDWFNWFKKKDITHGSGEVHSIKEMIDYMNSNFNTDSSRIFVSGLSAGAAMTVALMACYPEDVNAGAIFAGAPYKVARNPFEALFVFWLPPNKSDGKWAKLVFKQNPDYTGDYPRMVVVHGRLDFVLSIRNAYELVQQWTAVHKTDVKPQKKERPFNKNPDITRLAYNDAENKEVVVFYILKDIGHALALNPGDKPDEGGKLGMFGKDVNFHSTWWVAKDFGLIKQPVIPNP